MWLGKTMFLFTSTASQGEENFIPRIVVQVQ